MDNSTYKLRCLIQDIKKRWRIRTFLQGLSLTVLALLFSGTLFLVLNYSFELNPFVRAMILGFGSILSSVVLVKFLILPMTKMPDDRQIALYIEEQIPGLEDRMNAAYEIDRDRFSKRKTYLIDKLVNDALLKAELIDIKTVVDRKKERILSYSSNALLALFLFVLFSNFDTIIDSAENIEFTLNPIAAFSNEFVSIEPGNVELEKGDSQEIIASLSRETESELVLHYSSGDRWQTVKMEKGIDKYIFSFYNIQEPVKYFVEVEDTKSPEYEIVLYEYPKVTGIDLTYRYPEYTKLPPRVEENSGDIRGLKGSVVELKVKTSGNVQAGSLQIDGNRVPLERAEDGTLSGKVLLNQSGRYQVVLIDVNGKQNKFPEEYRITPVDDEPPLIHVIDPQRDVMANPVEEVMLAVTVSDDFGISSVGLNYTLNGDEEFKEALMTADSKGKRTVDGAYIFYLEDHTLQPGDVISYYVDAEDGFPREEAETSDIYFIEIIPLDNRYSQAAAQPPGGGGGGGQSPLVVNQQKTISATWNLRRSEKNMTPGEFSESLDAVIQAQDNLKSSIEERINSTAFSTEMLDEENQKIADLLRESVDEMSEALDELNDAALKRAVKEEQQALTKLLRANALNKEKQVQMREQNQSGGGGGGQMSNDRMTELMDLELDIKKNKYEMQQQRMQEQQSQEIDETLQKLEELARKQEKLAEDSRKKMTPEEEERNLDRLRREQEQLKQDVEDLANQMQQMSRENEQMTRDMKEGMQRAVENMEKATEELKEKDTRQARSQQQQAMNELEKIQRDLQLQQTDNVADMVEHLVNSFDRLKENEDEFAEDLDETYRKAIQENDPVTVEDIERLIDEREAAINELENLEELAENIESSARSENSEVANSMRNLRNDFRRETLKKSLDESKESVEQGWLTWSRIKEGEIKSSIERLDGSVRQLDQMEAHSEEEQVEQQLQDIRDMLTKYNEIKETIDEIEGVNPPPNREESAGDEKEQSAQQQNQKTEEQNSQRPENSRGGRGEGMEEARLDNQMEQMAQQLENMRRGAGGGDRQTEEMVRSAERAFGRFDNAGVLIDNESAKEIFKASVYDPLAQIEEMLIRKLDQYELERKVYGGRKADVPPQYRKLVDKYYESISKKKKK